MLEIYAILYQNLSHRKKNKNKKKRVKRSISLFPPTPDDFLDDQLPLTAADINRQINDPDEVKSDFVDDAFVMADKTKQEERHVVDNLGNLQPSN